MERAYRRDCIMHATPERAGLGASQQLPGLLPPGGPPHKTQLDPQALPAERRDASRSFPPRGARRRGADTMKGGCAGGRRRLRAAKAWWRVRRLSSEKRAYICI